MIWYFFCLADDTEENDRDKDSEAEKCIKEKTSSLRKRRNRSHFTQYQLQYLEKIFSRQQYLTRDERTILARGLEMTELQIRNWFQNRRYHKKHRAIGEAKREKTDSLRTTTSKTVEWVAVLEHKEIARKQELRVIKLVSSTQRSHVETVSVWL